MTAHDPSFNQCIQKRDTFDAKEAIMIAAVAPVRRSFHILLLVAITALPGVAWTQCAGIREEGRWRNLDKSGDPAFLDIKMLGGCGDQVLNGQQNGSDPRYTMRAWVRQSTGKFYGRPTAKASYRLWKGKRWLQGNVSTGGYQDQMWALVEDHEGKSQLHVVITHKSLDSKPSAQSEYWFTK
jgi:hypothetical protein